MKGGTYTPAQTVTLGDETYQVMSACKPHDCGSQRIAVMWSEKSNQMTGLFSTIDEKTSQEKLTGLNVNDALRLMVNGVVRGVDRQHGKPSGWL